MDAARCAAAQPMPHRRARPARLTSRQRMEDRHRPGRARTRCSRRAPRGRPPRQRRTPARAPPRLRALGRLRSSERAVRRARVLRLAPIHPCQRPACRATRRRHRLVTGLVFPRLLRRTSRNASAEVRICRRTPMRAGTRICPTWLPIRRRSTTAVPRLALRRLPHRSSSAGRPCSGRTGCADRGRCPAAGSPSHRQRTACEVHDAERRRRRQR
jgi:hypothetical protein